MSGVCWAGLSVERFVCVWELSRELLHCMKWVEPNQLFFMLWTVFTNQWLQPKQLVIVCDRKVPPRRLPEHYVQYAYKLVSYHRALLRKSLTTHIRHTQKKVALLATCRPDPQLNLLICCNRFNRDVCNSQQVIQHKSEVKPEKFDVAALKLYIHQITHNLCFVCLLQGVGYIHTGILCWTIPDMCQITDIMMWHWTVPGMPGR